MKRRQFIQISALACTGSYLIPGFSRTDHSEFISDWNAFTGQEGVSQSSETIPNEILERVGHLLPLGISGQPMTAVHTYQHIPGSAFFTAFELQGTAYPMKQYILPFWREDRSREIRDLQLLNAHELACLVHASKTSGLSFLPQLDANAAKQPMCTNGIAVERLIRFQDGAFVHEWKIRQGEKILGANSFKRNARNLF